MHTRLKTELESRPQLRRVVALVAAIAIAPCLAACSFLGPLGPFAGGELRGDAAPWPTDWRHAANVENIGLATLSFPTSACSTRTMVPLPDRLGPNKESIF